MMPARAFWPAAAGSNNRRTTERQIGGALQYYAEKMTEMRTPNFSLINQKITKKLA
jgi:hypothetical protein